MQVLYNSIYQRNIVCYMKTKWHDLKFETVGKTALLIPKKQVHFDVCNAWQVKKKTTLKGCLLSGIKTMPVRIMAHVVQTDGSVKFNIIR